MKFVKRLVALCACVGLLTIQTVGSVYAEEATPTPATEGNDYDTNSEYYTKLCSQSLSSLPTADQAKCKAYVQYMSNQSSNLREELANIEAQRTEIAANIKEYAAKVAEYNTEISSLNGDITSLNTQINEIQSQIDVKTVEIETKQADIEAKEADINALNQKIKDRMVSAQSGMRLNQYLDVVMGAKDFNDLIRITNGLNDITGYDQTTLDSLADLIEELNKAKAELEVAKEELNAEKAELDAAKQEIVDKQNTLIYYRQQAQVIEEEYRKQSADLEAAGNKIAANIEAIQSKMAELTNELNAIAETSGFIRPVSGGRVSAGTWYYNLDVNGGVHLGEDFAASVGTPIYAAGNGVIIAGADGCGTGYLGNSCGAPSGSSGGGNQVYLLTRINGSLYAVKYLHMLAGTPLPVGTIVSAGQVIGQVGASGNATGPHTHVEVFFLGNASLSEYANSWGGDLAFGAGWGSAALGRLCENGVGAPCRIKPESVFGS